MIKYHTTYGISEDIPFRNYKVHTKKSHKQIKVNVSEADFGSDHRSNNNLNLVYLEIYHFCMWFLIYNSLYIVYNLYILNIYAIMPYGIYTIYIILYR